MDGQGIGKKREDADNVADEFTNHVRARSPESSVSVIRYVRQCDRSDNPTRSRTLSVGPYTDVPETLASDSSCMPSEFFGMLLPILESAFTTGRNSGVEWEHRANGNSIWKSVLLVPEFKGGDEVTSVLVIISDVTEQKEMEQQIRAIARSKAAELEEERRRIAHELHDELGQLLIVLRMSLMLSAKTTASETQENHKEPPREVAMVDSIIQSIRDVSQSLRPAMLDMGLVAAFQWLTTRLSGHTGIRCIVRSSVCDVDIPEEQKMAMFRITQESLTNAARHGKAGQIEVTLSREGNVSILEVKDNGVGFDMGARKKTATLGLTGMRERAIGAGGRLEVWSRPECGTVVRAIFAAAETTRTPGGDGPRDARRAASNLSLGI